MQHYAVRVLAAFFLAICSPKFAWSAPATLFDSFTGATQTYLNLSPRTFMGFAPTLSSVGGSSNITVTGGNAYLVATLTANYTNIRLNIMFWGTASGATLGSTQAFSNLLGSYSFDLGSLHAVASTCYTYAFTLPTPVILPGQTAGVSINWQGDSGGGLVSTDDLTSLVRLNSPLAVGSLSVGTAGTYGVYDNLSGQTNGNFPGSDFSYYGNATDQCLGLQLFGLASTPPTIGGAVAGQTMNDNATIAPFTGVTIGDVDVPAQTLSVSVTLDTAAKGSFTTLNGFTNAGSGVYTFSGTAAAATTAIRGLVFTPTSNRVPAGSTETTTFTISVNDGTGPVTNNTTTVVSTSMNDFTTWAQSKFTAAELLDANVSGPDAVFGLDGLSNLIKYALGLEPKTNITTGLPAVTVVGSEWYFIYVRPVGLTDITYTVQVSTDLTTWTTVATHEFVSTSGGLDTYRGRYPLASAPNAFFRLNVTQP